MNNKPIAVAELPTVSGLKSINLFTVVFPVPNQEPLQLIAIYTLLA